MSGDATQRAEAAYREGEAGRLCPEDADGDQVQQINEAVNSAPPETLKNILKEWIPQVVSVGAGIATLFKALGIGGWRRSARWHSPVRGFLRAWP